MIKPKTITTRKQRRYGSLVATLFFAFVCFIVLLEDPLKYGAPSIGIVVTKMPRKLAVPDEANLKKGQALVQSSLGKCEDDACKAPTEEKIPKTLWMLWDTGFENADQAAKRSYDSWVQYNPEWEVKGLTLPEAEKLTKVLEEGTDGYLGAETWHSMSIQAKSDYIRISLLHHYGGVWADASLQCNQPLDEWIDLDRDYLFFLRDEQHPNNAFRLYPWYSSWWMAAPPESHAASLIFDEVVQFLRFAGSRRREYFWFHRIVAKLWNTDESFTAAIGPAESARGPHCMLGNKSFVDQHMFKRCARGVIEEDFNLITEQVWKENEHAADTAEKKKQ